MLFNIMDFYILYLLIGFYYISNILYFILYQITFFILYNLLILGLGIYHHGITYMCSIFYNMGLILHSYEGNASTPMFVTIIYVKVIYFMIIITLNLLLIYFSLYLSFDYYLIVATVVAWLAILIAKYFIHYFIGFQMITNLIMLINFD